MKSFIHKLIARALASSSASRNTLKGSRSPSSIQTFDGNRVGLKHEPIENHYLKEDIECQHLNMDAEAYRKEESENLREEVLVLATLSGILFCLVNADSETSSKTPS